MKVWILGKDGQLGNALVDHCQKENISFIASDKKQADITFLDPLKKNLEKNNCTHIINCAAYTNVDQAEKEPEIAYAVNALGPENLGILGKEFGVNVIHVSTDYVFDGLKKIPYVEDDTPHPVNTYGKTKYEGEQRLLKTLPKACVVRTSWIFGGKTKHFISSLFHLLKNEPKIHVVSDQINRATYHRDLAEVLMDLSFRSGIFHFANDKPLSRFEIARDFYREMQKRNIPMKCQEIIPISSQDISSSSRRPLYSVLSTEKVAKILGKKPRPWETVLSEYLDHVTSQS